VYKGLKETRSKHTIFGKEEAQQTIMNNESCKILEIITNHLTIPNNPLSFSFYGTIYLIL
jgi:hypothetical protein